ncbi:hypothetical protein F5Y15DRAFT_419747 [Xylariaceae sp. FL0016]|nr:hypothetical protein F5Y15DRAFT_419747 [Xylariaceae sp. FL0016]
MAWPPSQFPEKESGVPPGLETIPKRDALGHLPPKSRLIHGDLHYRNIMINGLEPCEHRIDPVLKLIDFGMAKDQPSRASEPPDFVVKTNISAIGDVMLSLIGGNRLGGVRDMTVTDQGVQRTLRSYAGDLDSMSSVYTTATAADRAKHQRRVDNLDRDMRDLIALCLAQNLTHRPSIEFLLPEVERHVKQKALQDYAGNEFQQNEGDESLKRLFRDLILDA